MNRTRGERNTETAGNATASDSNTNKQNIDRHDIELMARRFPPLIMAEPTKQETEQAFRVLKAQKANKVCLGLDSLDQV